MLFDDPFDIVDDSSIWRDSGSFVAVEDKDPYLRRGIIKKVIKDNSTNKLKFLVEVYHLGRQLETICDLMLRSGGVFNYEEIVPRGYKIEDKLDEFASYNAKPGDMVIVASLNGQFREGIILGFMMHTSRKATLDYEKGPQHIQEFNGVETHINENGEYKLTFKGLQKNIDKLKEKPTSEAPKPQYDDSIGGSYLKFDKTGSFLLTDSAKENPQSINIDKTNGSLVITSGKIVLTMSKNDEKISIKNKITNIDSETSISQNTKEFSVSATGSTKLKSPKIAIGNDGTELLDQLAKLIDGLGKVQPISPLGPCTPLQATPQWAEVMSIKSKIKDITGAL